MNRKIRQLAAAFIVLYVVLFAAMNYWQVGRESELNAMSGNTRAIRREFSRPRGEIVSADGVIAARSIPLPDDNEFPYQREYPTGDLFANVTGYYSLALGATQLERTQNSVLTGQTAEQRIGNLEDIVTGGQGTGDVHMTLRSDLQDTAREALAGRRGSVVMLDTRTGAVLAMYSNPTYDPNRIVDPNFDAARDALEELLEAPGNPLLANAYQERYMPGSTFKVLTTGIALDAGVVSLDSQFDRVTEWTPPQTSNPIQNYDGSNCGGDLREVFRRSCNIPFAQTALNVGIPGMVSGVQAWGVGENVPIDLPRPAASTFGSTDNLDQQLPLLAMRGFGQQEDQMVPLHMAMVAAAVANNGVMMKPFVVGSTTDSQGRTLTRTQPEEWKRPISPETAATLNSLMQSVATDGTASCCLQLNGGVPVAAKTGTAQLNEAGQPERSNAWIVAFAPANEPRYAVSVVLLDSPEVSAGTGGRLAGPIAQQMLNEALANG
ncbi:MAG: penicillin-binding protein [Desertimonas sp.]|nr:penicillin-binding protein [Desertimonas sp.]